MDHVDQLYEIIDVIAYDMLILIMISKFVLLSNSNHNRCGFELQMIYGMELMLGIRVSDCSSRFSETPIKDKKGQKKKL